MGKAMKAMKAMAAMKAMKAMKKKSVSKIAKGSHAKSMIFRGTKEKTVGGLTKSDLIKNKYGKVVSKKASLRAKKNSGWTTAIQKARKALGLKGFVAIKGLSSLRKGQGTLSVSVYGHAEASAQGVGMSTPFE